MRLPVRYAEIDGAYIVGDYAISSGLDVDSADEWIITYARHVPWNPDNGNKAVIGGGYSKTDSNMCLWLNNSTNLVEFTYGDGGNANYKVTTTAYDVCQFHTYRMKLSTGESWIDGDYIGTPQSVSSVPHPKPCIINGVWRGTSMFNQGAGVIKEFIILRNGVEVRHYIPAIDLSSGQTGLYDLCESICESTGTPLYYKSSWAYAGDTEAAWSISASAASTTYHCYASTSVAGSTIDWGDGFVETLTADSAANVSHTYANAGTYTIQLHGVMLRDFTLCAADTGNEGVNILDLHTYSGAQAFKNMCLGAASITASNTKFERTTIVGDNCFKNCAELSLDLAMLRPRYVGTEAFRYCAKLKLPSLSQTCYKIGQSGFEGCSLLAFGSLPDTLTSIGYYVFKRCSQLKIAALPANVTRIEGAAFSSCSSIEKLTMPASLTHIGDGAFEYCTSLTEIRFDGTPSSLSTSAFSNCAALADIYVPWKMLDVANSPWGATSATIHYSCKELPVPLNFVATEANSTVALTAVGSPSAISLQYSTDGTTWSSYTVGTTITLANVGDKVYFMGNNTTFSSSGSNYYHFVMAGTIEAYGNVNSLYDSTCKSVTLPRQDYFFAYLFYGCDALVRAPALPSTTLRTRCYSYMFYGTSIEEAPDLPGGLKNYCYQRMFYGCPHLKRISITRTTSSYSGPYMAMCEGCASLNYVYCTLTAWPTSTNATNNWLAGVAATGTFVCLSALDTTIRDASHVPVGWTVENI